MKIDPKVQSLHAESLEILQSLPMGSALMKDIEKANILIQTAGDAPTHYTSKFMNPETRVHEPAILLNDKLASTGSEKAQSVLEACSIIAHEMIHALHAWESQSDYRFRNTSEPINKAFGNQEEELTITGQSGRFKDPRNENAIRKELGLPPRSGH